MTPMGTTSDSTDPRLTHGVDAEPGPMAEVYLVLSEAERAKGYVRPLRKTYVHHYFEDGTPVPLFLSNETIRGIKGCGAATTMATAIAETYAVNPAYYGATYCVGCRMHLPVEEFHWDGSEQRVGS